MVLLRCLREKFPGSLGDMVILRHIDRAWENTLDPDMKLDGVAYG